LNTVEYLLTLVRDGDRVRETEPVVAADWLGAAGRTSRWPTRPCVRPLTGRSGPVPGISGDERGDVFDAGYSTVEDGSGFGPLVVE